MAIGDLDGDGDMDIARLVVENHGSRNAIWSVAMTHGFGDGTFGPSDQIELPYEAEDLDLGDLDGDGLAELVVVWNDRDVEPGFSKGRLGIFTNQTEPSEADCSEGIDPR